MRTRPAPNAKTTITLGFRVVGSQESTNLRALGSCTTATSWPPAERKLQLTAILVPGEEVPGLYLHPDHRRRLRRTAVRSALDV